jgi:hypothetical protein
MPGFISAVNPSIKVPIGATRLYYICFLNGFAISSVVLIALHRFFPSRSHREFVNDSWTAKETMAFYQDRWDHTGEVEPDKEVEAVIEMPKDV